MMTSTDAINDKTHDAKKLSTYGLDAWRRTLNIPKTPEIITSVPAHNPEAVSPYDAFKYSAKAPAVNSPHPDTTLALERTHVSL